MPGKGKGSSSGGKGAGGNARSAITGRYVKQSTAKRHPDKTVVEKRSKGQK
jgi:hypothetical protein